MSIKDIQFARAAAALSRSAPNEWQTFLNEVQRHTLERAQALVASPSDLLQQNQGRALEARDFCDFLQNCRNLADKVVEKRSEATGPRYSA